MKNIQHKALPVTGFKVLSEDEGIVETIVSVTGIVDAVNDIIEPGAYAKTLAQRLPKGVWSHDWDTPIARTLSAEELLPGDSRLPKQTKDGKPWPREAGAVMVTAQFNLETQRGREAYSDVKFFGDGQEWSIGYNVPRGGANVESKTGIRRINTLDWYEYSPVLFGAMPEAVTRSVKSKARAWLDEAAAAPKVRTCPGCENDEETKAKCKRTRKCVLTGMTLRIKALPGSLESLREALGAAAQAAVRAHTGDDDVSVSVHSTLGDAVVVEVWEPGEPGGVFYAMTYEVTPDGDVTLGSPARVRIGETLEPDTDEAPEAPEEPLTESPEEKSLTLLDPRDVLTQETFRNYLS